MKITWWVLVGVVVLLGSEMAIEAQDSSAPARATMPQAAASAPATSPATTSVTSTPQAKPSEQWSVLTGGKEQTIRLGSVSSESPYLMSLVLTNRGAGIEAAVLNRFSREEERQTGPYRIIQMYGPPMSHGTVIPFASVRCHLNGKQVDLEHLPWQPMGLHIDEHGVMGRFEVTLVRKYPHDPPYRPYLRISKTFDVQKNDYHFRVSVTAENLSDGPLRLTLVERGPIGIPRYVGTSDRRGVWAGYLQEDRKEVVRVRRLSPQQAVDQSIGGSRTSPPLVWAGLANRYFACLVHHRAAANDDLRGETTYNVTMRRYGPCLPTASGFGIEFEHGEFTLDPHQRLTLSADVYLGPLDEDGFAGAPLSSPLGYRNVFDRPISEPRIESMFGSELRPSSFCLSDFLGLVMARVLSSIQWIVPSAVYGPAVAVVLIAVALKILLCWPFMANGAKAIRHNRLALNNRTVSGQDPRPSRALSNVMLAIHGAVIVGIIGAVSHAFELRSAGLPIVHGGWISLLREPDTLLPMFGEVSVGSTSYRLVLPSADLHLLPFLLGIVVLFRFRYTCSHWIMLAVLTVVLSYFLPSAALVYLLTANAIGLLQLWRLARGTTGPVGQRGQEPLLNSEQL
ncbi:YidC/Oxa1 family insertase periplasmic-domain containing protein [bacterium]|nr:YidC/Oxa1 family insertase periplasmic-domain containing protein [bacterium]